jgi:hypothetical protein
MELTVQPSIDMQKVRQRAYELWQADGMTSGRALEHWCEAERELVCADEMVPLARPKTSRSRKTAPRKS